MMDGTITAAAEIEAGIAPAEMAAVTEEKDGAVEGPEPGGAAEAVEPTEGADRAEKQAGPTSMSHELRILEAMLFAATEPVEEASLAERMPDGCDLSALLSELAAHYEGRGVRLTRVAGRWAFRTAEDLAPHLRIERKVPRKLSRAAVETLAIVAYHQPVTRGEIEEIRGVALSKGTLDVLLEAGWIRPVGRRRTPGKPITWGTSTAFLDEFGLASLSDLPGVDELKAAGLLDSRPVTTIFGEAMGREDAQPQSEDEADEAVDGDESPAADADAVEAGFLADGEEEGEPVADDRDAEGLAREG